MRHKVTIRITKFDDGTYCITDVYTALTHAADALRKQSIDDVLKKIRSRLTLIGLYSEPEEDGLYRTQTGKIMQKANNGWVKLDNSRNIRWKHGTRDFISSDWYGIIMEIGQNELPLEKIEETSWL